jgi:hypothetical protein
MAFQIYQAWLQGPSALFRLFEEAFGRQALYGPPDPDMQQREIDALSEQVGRLQARNERLQAEVSDLLGRNFRLQRRNAEMESLLVKDSYNSSCPPLTNPPWAKRTGSLLHHITTYSGALRRRADERRHGQPASRRGQ